MENYFKSLEILVFHCHVEDRCRNDKEIKYVPRVPHITPLFQDEPLGDSLNQKLHKEDVVEADIDEVKCLVQLEVDSLGGGLIKEGVHADHNTSNDNDDQDEVLKLLKVLATQPKAKSPQEILLGEQKKRFVTPDPYIRIGVLDFNLLRLFDLEHT